MCDSYPYSVDLFSILHYDWGGGYNIGMSLRFQLSLYTSAFATHILPAVQFCSRKQDRDRRPSRAACTSVSCL